MSARYQLCLMCGTISLERDWTYWHRNLADDYPPDEEWVPVRPGECDPMAKCPACKWEHTDTDDGSGFYEGTLDEMEEQRAKDEPDCADTWAYVLSGATA